MKNRIFIVFVVLITFISVACSDFLSESSQDEVRPSTANELGQLLLGEAYPLHKYFLPYLDLLTDDVESIYNVGDNKTLMAGSGVFTWQSTMFETMVQNNLENSVWDTWEHYYSRIKGCNVVLDMMDRVDGSVAEKANVKGQALATRAYYHFMLVNLFGQPYNADGVDITSSPGVPLMTSSKVSDKYPPRSSVAKVYEQVERDLLEAAPLLDEYGKDNIKNKATDLFPHTLLCRMYLYMEQWDKAMEQANIVLERNPVLQNLTATVKSDPFFGNSCTNVFYMTSAELIWGFSGQGESEAFFRKVIGNKYPSYVVSSGLDRLYEYNPPFESLDVKDLRREFSFMKYTNASGVTVPQFARKGDAMMMTDPQKGFRVAEVYLNRAECYIQKYIAGQGDEFRVAALKDLNYLRLNRYDTRKNKYEEVDIENGAALLNFYKDERRRELCFEEHRWFDLRRYGMPAIEHELTLSPGATEKHVLTAKDKRYVLPIPLEVIDKNPALEQNKY